MDAKKLRVILVDDDVDDRLLFKKAIADLKLNIELIQFEDGMQLMSFLDTEDFFLPTIIFLDLNMPVKNGMQCLKEIRSQKKFNDISIAIYSTSSSEQDINNTFVNGANIYIKKPYSFKKLRDAVGKVVKINWQYFNSTLNKETFILRL